MNKKNHNILKIALVFTGNVIGAGFATGTELTGFFVRYGKNSLFGLIFACIVFSLIWRIILIKIVETGACDYSEYFEDLNIHLVKCMKFIVTAYLWASLCIMYSAGGAVFYERLSLPRDFGIWSVALICIAVLHFGADGFVKLNAVLTPVLIIGIIYIGAVNFIPVFSNDNLIYFSSPVLYASYNTITAVPVLTAVSSYVDSKKSAIMSSYLTGIFLTVTGVSLWLLLYFYADLNEELPVLSVLDGAQSIIYIIILYIAILTTAVGNGISILKNMGLNKRRYLIILILPAFLSKTAGLNVLVSKLYSFFGGLGLFIMVITVIDGFKYLRKRKKTRDN